MFSIVAHGREFRGTLREIEEQLDQHERQRRADLRRRAKARQRQKRGPLNLWAVIRGFLGW